MNLFTNEKHYNTLNNYYKYKYKRKVYKIPLNGGFTCPNIDGTVATGGCTFCSYMGSGDFAGNKFDPLKVQFKQGKDMMIKKWGEGLYIPYFQANTNTHGTLSKLKTLFEEAITLDKDNVMISIATRPDALDDEKIAYLVDLNKRMPVQIELGLQTIHNETGKLINRGHNLEVFDKIVKKLKDHNFEIVVHIINGLPNETKEMMVETAKYVNSLNISGIKIHMLHIMEKTKMGFDYKKNPWNLLTLEEYVDITVTQLRHLNKNMIIHRLTGDAPRAMLLAPNWTLKKFIVLNEIDKLMRKNKYYQGDLCA